MHVKHVAPRDAAMAALFAEYASAGLAAELLRCARRVRVRRARPGGFSRRASPGLAPFAARARDTGRGRWRPVVCPRHAEGMSNRVLFSGAARQRTPNAPRGVLRSRVATELTVLALMRWQHSSSSDVCLAAAAPISPAGRRARAETPDETSAACRAPCRGLVARPSALSLCPSCARPYTPPVDTASRSHSSMGRSVAPPHL